MSRGWATVFAAILVACRAAAAPTAAPAAAGPDHYDWPEGTQWSTLIRPVPPEPSAAEPSASEAEDRAPTAAEKVEFASVALLCRSNARAGAERCRELDPYRATSCLRVCADALENRPRDAENQHRDAGSSLPARPLLPVGTTAPGPVPPQPLDPYDAALRTCIRQVWTSGHEAVCHFDPPFDQMDFGQHHCNAKCASMTVEVRAR
jgi:hypothetical protein